MPGFVTHYLFGLETYLKLPNNTLKKNLHYNRAAYALGLQGPDIFFYYLPSYVLHENNPGALAHSTDTQTFFHHLLESRKLFHTSAKQKIAAAYLSGFLGHYTLDTICHPFVYGRTHYRKKDNAYFSRHAYLETDIDTNLLALKLKRQPCTFQNAATIKLTFQQKIVISSMLFYAYRRTYPNLHVKWLTMFIAIFSIQLGMHILHDDSGQKKVLFRWAEKHFLGYPLFSPLIASDTLFFRTDPLNMQHKKWTNPWDSSLSSTESFFDLYENAELLYQRRLKKLSNLLHCEQNTREESVSLHELLNDYGNNSFLSGLNALIPNS